MIDLNCDMGEGMANDAAIMPFISSCNIACGFHAGSGDLIRRTIDLALKYDVKIGAHPSFRDKENFGRKEMRISNDKLYALVLEQLIKIDLIAREKGIQLHHVKPHGAMYNMAAKDQAMAATLAQAVMDFDESLVLYGRSGSYLVSEANHLGLPSASEVFADRTYMDDGSLCPRTEPKALIEDNEVMKKQVMQMIKEGSVTTLSGMVIPVKVETICIHGDGRNAVAFAKTVREILNNNAGL